MKKLFILATFLLSSCGEAAEISSCNSDSTHPEYTVEEWQDLEYHLPYCWTEEEKEESLFLLHGEGEAYVEFTPIPVEENLSNEDYVEFKHKDQTLYFVTNNMDHPDVQKILQSLTE